MCWGNENMELYAKSKPRQLSDKKRKELRENLENLLEVLGETLTPREQEIITQEMEKIQNPKEELQKTLRSHEEDIIRCVEAFFHTYGSYFTKMEKVLILQACRQHDWGKANLIF